MPTLAYCTSPRVSKGETSNIGGIALANARACAFLLLFCFKFERGRVHAIAQAGWLWAVVENVAEMAFAPGAFNLDTLFAKALVDLFYNVLFVNRPEKAWPAGVGLILGIRAENRQAAAGTVIRSFLLVLKQVA